MGSVVENIEKITLKWYGPYLGWIISIWSSAWEEEKTGKVEDGIRAIYRGGVIKR